MFRHNPDDDLERLEQLARLGDPQAQKELRERRINTGLCGEHGLSNCVECNTPEELVWDDLKNTETRAAELAEEEPDLTADEAWQQASSDDVYSTRVWNDLLVDLTAWMKKTNPNSNLWEVSAEGLGWQRVSGNKIIKANTGRELLQKILPKTDCTFTIYKWRDKNELKIVNSHHDASGEVYWIRPSQDEDEVEYRRNPDDLERLREQLELDSSPELRAYYLTLQMMHGNPIDISILKESDLVNAEILAIVNHPVGNIAFGLEQLPDLLPRFKNIILNKLSAKVYEGKEIGNFRITSDFDIVRVGWFPETRYEDPYFAVITRQLSDLADDAAYFKFSIPYTFRNSKLVFPYEYCYVCQQSGNNHRVRFEALDSFIAPIGMTPLELLVSPPDYLSAEGAYGDAPYSEAGMHYQVSGHPVIWYSLYAEGTRIEKVGIGVSRPNTYKYAGLERPSSLLPDRLIRQLTERGRSDYNIQMPNFILDSNNYFSRSLTLTGAQNPKTSGFRNVYVRCSDQISHQFPLFMWRLPKDVSYYPLIGRSLTDIGSDFSGVKISDGEIRGFDLGII